VRGLEPLTLDKRCVSGSRAVDVGVNADAKRVEIISFGIGAHNLDRPPPKINVPTPVLRKNFQLPTNPDYARKLLPIVLRAVDEYVKSLNLPISRPLTTNEIARFKVEDYGGWPHSVLELTNGWQFVCNNSMVNGYYAPDNLFYFRRSGQKTLVKDYSATWRLTEDQAIALIRQTLAKLNYSINLIHMDFKPKVLKPAVPGIPRCEFWWEFENEAHDELISTVKAEVDMDQGELKSLYFDNKTFRNHLPAIDVPISKPSSRQPEDSNPPQAGTPPKTPARPFTPFDASKQP